MTIPLTVPLYDPRPGVDVEVESVGAAMRAAIWDLFESDIYNDPLDILYVFDSLFIDIAVEHGWWQDADGRWYQPVLYAEASA